MSLRPEANALWRSHVELVDCFEIVMDHCLHGLLPISEVPRTRPLVGHSLNLSIGSCELLDATHLQRLSDVARSLSCEWISDHIAFTTSQGNTASQLLPVEFTPIMARHMAGKMRSIAAQFAGPVLLENTTYYFREPRSTLDEMDFILAIMEESQCGLLLDLNNLYANSVNHGYCPYKFLDSLPPERVLQLHVAGGTFQDGLYIDSHDMPVGPEVLDLTAHAIRTLRPNCLILERDSNLPDAETLVAELTHLKELWNQTSTRYSHVSTS